MRDRVYERLVATARQDDRVVGLVLTGSRGREVFVRADSDWDVRLIARDDSLSECRTEYGTEHGSLVDVVVFSLGEFERIGAIGSESEWDRYSYAHADVVVDKLDGAIGRLVAEKAVLPAQDADRLAAYWLDGYINSYYRSAKNAGVGLRVESQLDAAESVGYFLSALFAMYGRVRPFNKFLGWELDGFPVDGVRWSSRELLARVGAICGSGDLVEPQALFRSVEQLARERGLGSVIDGWEPDLALLRGDGVLGA